MEHFYESIPGWFAWAPIYKWMVDNAPAKGAWFAEVGCWKGRSSACMAVEIINSKKDIGFVCVDHFQGEIGNPAACYLGDPDLGQVDKVFRYNMRPVEGHYVLFQMDSPKAARCFANETFDFVFIDGDHRYEGCKADIVAWLPKVRPGCILGGDDATEPGVRAAIEEMLPGHTVRNGRIWLYIKP